MSNIVKHKVGPGPNDYVYVKRFGVEPCRYTKRLQKVFPKARILDPHVRDPTGRRNPIYVASGAFGPRVYVRQPDGALSQPVHLTLTGDLEGDVLTWYRCLREVYNDVGIGLQLEELELCLHCLNAANKITAKQANLAVKLLTRTYREEGNL